MNGKNRNFTFLGAFFTGVVEPALARFFPKLLTSNPNIFKTQNNNSQSRDLVWKV